MLVSGLALARSTFSNDAFCSTVTAYSIKVNKDVPMMLDRLTRLEGVKVDCAAKIFEFKKFMSIEMAKLRTGWQQLQQDQWNRNYCRGTNLGAVKFGWIIRHTMKFADGKVHRMDANCISNGTSSELMRENLRQSYFQALDAWVESGGDIKQVQKELVKNCGKLVLASVPVKTAAAMMGPRREDFHFRVDVCVKTTVNRVHPQPEFKIQKILTAICGSNIKLFRELCQKTGLSE